LPLLPGVAGDGDGGRRGRRVEGEGVGAAVLDAQFQGGRPRCHRSRGAPVARAAVPQSIARLPDLGQGDELVRIGRWSAIALLTMAWAWLVHTAMGMNPTTPLAPRVPLRRPG